MLFGLFIISSGLQQLKVFVADLTGRVCVNEVAKFSLFLQTGPSTQINNSNVVCICVITVKIKKTVKLFDNKSY